MLGLYRGQTVEVVENRGWGPVILKVGDTKFVLGRGQAARILVQPLYEEGRS
ncbi:FeoA family protein [Thermosulfurimonas sp.]|uniref:FeoA family protein n=1 Tax=Thermosulfurimonas sp. TaxID=2080236 RepID=UPI003425D058